MEKKDFFAALYQKLSRSLKDIELWIIDEEDYPRSADFLVVSDSFESMHEVDIANMLLKEFKAALGEEFYTGLYSYTGMTKSSFENSYSGPKGRLYQPHRSESHYKIGASSFSEVSKT